MLGVRHFHGCAIDLWQGDITEFAVDAIVNAANASLSGGGGVDGAIHRVGGPAIMEECRRLGSCAIGQAVVTTAGALPARWVIHTVGPVWQGGEHQEHELLQSSIRESLVAAARLGAHHISLPAISTGVYRFPLRQAADLSLRALRAYLSSTGSLGEMRPAPRRITFILFDAPAYEAFAQALSAVFPEEGDGS